MCSVPQSNALSTLSPLLASGKDSPLSSQAAEACARCPAVLCLEAFGHMQILRSRAEWFPLRRRHSIGCYDH